MEDSPFGNPLYLGDGHDGPLYALYANWKGLRGPYGTFLLAKGTEAEITRLHRHWTTNPDAFDRFAFAHRR